MRMQCWALRVGALWSVKLHGGSGWVVVVVELLKNELNLIVSLEIIFLLK